MHVHAKWTQQGPVQVYQIGLFATLAMSFWQSRKTPQTQHTLVCSCPLQWDGGLQSLRQLWRTSMLQDVSLACVRGSKAV